MEYVLPLRCNVGFLTWRMQESCLRNSGCAVIMSQYCHKWESHLIQPRIHDCFNVQRVSFISRLLMSYEQSFKSTSWRRKHNGFCNPAKWRDSFFSKSRPLFPINFLPVLQVWFDQRNSSVICRTCLTLKWTLTHLILLACFTTANIAVNALK